MTRRPSAPAAATVRLATRTLPAGTLRERYRCELLAELHALTPSRQLRFSLGVAAQAWALRRALTEEDSMFHQHVTPPDPLLCRLHLHHVWRTASTEDGQRYRRCINCGKDHPGTGNGPGDWAHGGMGTTGTGSF